MSPPSRSQQSTILWRGLISIFDFQLPLSSLFSASQHCRERLAAHLSKLPAVIGSGPEKNRFNNRKRERKKERVLIRVWLAPVVIFEWMLEGCVLISCLLAREQKEAYFMLYTKSAECIPVSNPFFCSPVHNTVYRL